MPLLLPLPDCPSSFDSTSQIFIWCDCTVVEAGENPIHKSKRSKGAEPAVPIRVRWPADPEREEPETLVWLALHPEDWAKDVVHGWRYSATELHRQNLISRTQCASLQAAAERNG